MSDIRGRGQSVSDSDRPHKIVISKNFKVQGFVAPKRKFKNYKQAYLWGISHWGSGSLEESIRKDFLPKMGWAIKTL